MLTDAALARTFKALAHPRRAMFFRLLVLRPETGASLETLVAASGLPWSSAVHHLREMERCGVLSRRRKGRYMVYSLTPGELSMALGTALSVSSAAQRQAA
jgi:ArsR family transcriptional regulator, arsenate/arsenite/antimonite-responsive transcriptional repressor